MAAHPYIGVACSSALKLGLHVRSYNSPATTAERNCNQSRVFIAILKLDLYCSLILGLPTFLQPQDWQTAKLVLDPDRSIRGTRISDGDRRDNATRLELSSKGVELLNMTAEGMHTIFPPVLASRTGDLSEQGDPISLADLDRLKDQLQAWVRDSTIPLQRIHHSGDYNL